MTTREDAIAALDSYVSDATSQLKSELASLQAEFDAYKAAHPEQPPTPTPTPGGGTKRIGLYRSGNNKDTLSYVGKTPNIMSFYIQWGAGLPSTLTAAAKSGAVIQVAQLAKVNSTTFKRWADIANGVYDNELIDQIQKYENIALTYGVEVWLSFENEADARINNSGKSAPNQTPGEYVAAANHFADLVTRYAPHVQNSVWLAGFGAFDTVKKFLPSKSKFAHLGWDPYKTGTHPQGDGVYETAKRFYDGVVVPNGWDGKRLHLYETGIVVDKGFDVANQADYYNTMMEDMAKIKNLESVTIFCSNSGGKNYVPTSDTVKKAMTRAVTTN